MAPRSTSKIVFFRYATCKKVPIYRAFSGLLSGTQFVYAAQPRRRRCFLCPFDQKQRRILPGTPEKDCYLDKGSNLFSISLTTAIESYF
jgi:hypothetical protein